MHDDDKIQLEIVRMVRVYNVRNPQIRTPMLAGEMRNCERARTLLYK